MGHLDRRPSVAREVTLAEQNRQAEKLGAISQLAGGVPPNAVTAPGEGWRPDNFFSRLNAGTLGAESYHGLNFFLYSGDRDEEWGTKMSEQMAHAQKVLPLAGAKVAAWVRDPRGGHMGFRKTAAIHEQAIQLFLRLTTDGK